MFIQSLYHLIHAVQHPSVSRNVHLVIITPNICHKTSLYIGVCSHSNYLTWCMHLDTPLCQGSHYLTWYMQQGTPLCEGVPIQSLFYLIHAVRQTSMSGNALQVTISPDACSKTSIYVMESPSHHYLT